MSIYGTVVNKKGEEEYMSKPCFGFLNYIDQWKEHDCDDDCDDDDECDCENSSIDGFESDNLLKFIWNANIGEGYSVEPKTLELFRNDIPEILESYPVLFRGFTYLKGEQANKDKFEIALTDDYMMENTIMGAMSMRNLINYSAYVNSYALMRNSGYSVKLSFLLANFYQANRGMSTEFFRHNRGDDQIFPAETTLEDFKHLYNGGELNNQQSVWGTTDNGYGRNGDIPGTKGTNSRTGYYPMMIDCMILPEASGDKLYTIAQNTGYDQSDCYGFKASHFLAFVSYVSENV